jgi:hypothetical protein
VSVILAVNSLIAFDHKKLFLLTVAIGSERLGIR